MKTEWVLEPLLGSVGMVEVTMLGDPEVSVALSAKTGQAPWGRQVTPGIMLPDTAALIWISPNSL